MKWENSGFLKMGHMKNLKLTFHTSFNEEFSGDTPEQIIDALYQNSAKGIVGLSFENWWKYQQKTWSDMYDANIPEPDEDGACQKLLDFLKKIEALEDGPLPDSSQGTSAKGNMPDVR